MPMHIHQYWPLGKGIRKREAYQLESSGVLARRVGSLIFKVTRAVVFSIAPFIKAAGFSRFRVLPSELPCSGGSFWEPQLDPKPQSPKLESPNKDPRFSLRVQGPK